MTATPALSPARARDLAFVLLGVLGLVTKSQWAWLGGSLGHDHGGNVAASFAALFLLKLPVVPARVRLAAATALALLATELFELTDGFGFMSNTQDPGDYLANAIGVGLALVVEGIARRVARLRAGASARTRADPRDRSAAPRSPVPRDGGGRSTTQSQTEDRIMADAVPEVTTKDLQAFAEAWNRHDIEALMSFMTEDCVFESSAGPEACGTRYAGREAVRAGFAEVWAVYPDAQWSGARHFVQGLRGVSEWTFTGTRADGSRVEVQGCDLFTFRGGKIALKNSYRKSRPAAVAPTG